MANSANSGLSSFVAAANKVKPTTCPVSLLRFPPSSEPTALPPPSDHPTLAHPFTIPTDLYNAVLSPVVPITIAIAYTSTVAYLNTVSARRKYKPWAFSQTSIFKQLVILHNAILAVYSAWTFIGMLNAFILSFAGWSGEFGLAGALDSLCKINGPRGLGNAATYNETSAAWTLTNRALHLAADGLGPAETDVGRLWNEGLAFYGWLFYLSKFYEVIDTAIIIAKGKKSSFLQTYHHAGAMLCMWAGIRYMSPPIWMFVFVNSGIHAIMYTFYLCSVIRVPIPKNVKQTLTTLQITQFVVGATYAFAHLFVAYKVPVSVPYIYHLGSVVSSIASEARSDAQSATSSAIVAFSTAGVGAWLKKAALRAAGREGLAENVLNEQGQTFGVDAVNIVQDFVSREEVRFKDELQWTHCLDTSGQAFAILLNCMYLAPLTWLFVRFFITAYLKRIERRRSSTASEKAKLARQSFGDASKGFSRTMSEAINDMHAVVDDEEDPQTPSNEDVIKKDAEAVKAAVTQKINEAVERSKELKEKLGGSIGPIEFLQKQRAESVQKTGQSLNDTSERSTDTSDAATEQSKSTLTEDSTDTLVGNVKDKVETIAGSTKTYASQATQKIYDAPRSIQELTAPASEPEALERDGSGEDLHKEVDTGGDPEGEQRASSLVEEDNPEGRSSAEEPSTVDSDATSPPNDAGTGVEEATGAQTAQATQQQSTHDNDTPSAKSASPAGDKPAESSQTEASDDVDRPPLESGADSTDSDLPKESSEQADHSMNPADEAPPEAQSQTYPTSKVTDPSEAAREETPAEAKDNQKDEGVLSEESDSPPAEDAADAEIAPEATPEAGRTDLPEEPGASESAERDRPVESEDKVDEQGSQAVASEQPSHEELSTETDAQAQRQVEEAPEDAKAKIVAEVNQDSVAEPPTKEDTEQARSVITGEVKDDEVEASKGESAEGEDEIKHAENVADVSETSTDPTTGQSLKNKKDESEERSTEEENIPPIPQVRHSTEPAKHEADSPTEQEGQAESPDSEDEESKAEKEAEELSFIESPKVSVEQPSPPAENPQKDGETIASTTTATEPEETQTESTAETPEPTAAVAPASEGVEVAKDDTPTLAADVDVDSEPNLNGHKETDDIGTKTSKEAEEDSEQKRPSKTPSVKSKSSVSLQSSKDDIEKVSNSKSASLKSKSSLSLKSKDPEDLEEEDKENQEPAPTSSVRENNLDEGDTSSREKEDTRFTETVKE